MLSMGLKDTEYRDLLKWAIGCATHSDDGRPLTKEDKLRLMDTVEKEFDIRCAEKANPALKEVLDMFREAGREIR